ncbi:unnamed protein product [Arctogadus glacialis]
MLLPAHSDSSKPPAKSRAKTAAPKKAPKPRVFESDDSCLPEPSMAVSEPTTVKEDESKSSSHSDSSKPPAKSRAKTAAPKKAPKPRVFESDDSCLPEPSMAVSEPTTVKEDESKSSSHSDSSKPPAKSRAKTAAPKKAPTTKKAGGVLMSCYWIVFVNPLMLF